MSNNLFSIEGKTVVITGSAGTVGMVLCGLIAEQGGNVAAIDINSEGRLVEKQNPGSRFYECDLTDSDELEKTALRLKMIRQH